MHCVTIAHHRSVLRALCVLTVSSVAAGLSCSARAQSIAWSQRTVEGPSARYGHSMAFDASRGVTVLFGGFSGNAGLLGETWEWNGTRWAQAMVPGPTPRYGHAMAYDANRQVTVLFGGNGFGSSGNETWEWNGHVWSQRLVASPSPRYLHAMTFDSNRNVIVLFGGFGDTGRSDETWEWDGNTWVKRIASGPAARAQHTLSYDAHRGKSVLFGGSTRQDAVNSGIADTWEWDGVSWLQVSEGTIAPRLWQSACFDTDRATSVVFGGFHEHVYLGDSLVWDGSQWTQATVDGPPPRFAHAMAYDSRRGVTVLFGGAIPTLASTGDTWELGCANVVVSPATRTACLGSPATLSATVSGTGPHTFQWRRGTPPVAIPGATGATYAIASVVGADAGVYECAITNSCGVTTSGPARLIVCPADVTCDSSVDITDLLEFLAYFERGNPASDLDDGSLSGIPDGGIDINDLLFFLARFEAGC